MLHCNKKCFLKIFWILLINFLFFIPLISCGGVSSEIMNNLFDPSLGEGLFATNTSLKDEIRTALTSKTASDAFKKNITNELLYR
jgi:hypothetical protein